jgi:hypothetical protein
MNEHKKKNMNKHNKGAQTNIRTHKRIGEPSSFKIKEASDLTLRNILLTLLNYYVCMHLSIFL